MLNKDLRMAEVEIATTEDGEVELAEDGTPTEEEDERYISLYPMVRVLCSNF